MVVAYRTRQLMKSSKYVAASPGFPFSTYIPVYKNSFKLSRRGSDNFQQDSLVRLNCACRRFHSTNYFQSRREAKAAKLSPQEVFLLSLSWTASSGSENDAVILNEILEQSADAPRSPRNERAAPRDLLEVLLNVIVKTQSDRLDTVNDNYDASGDRITAFVEWFNDLVGYDVLVVGTTTVSTNSAAITDVIEDAIATLVSQHFDNTFVKNFVTSAVNSALEEAIGKLNISLNRNVSLELLKNVIAVTTINSTTTDNGATTVDGTTTDIGTDNGTDGTDDTAGTSISSRRKRAVGFPLNLLVSAVRSFVENVFGPIHDSIGYSLNNVTNTLLGLVNTENRANPITQVVYNVLNRVVVQAAAFVQNLHDGLDALYTNIVNGTTSSSNSDDTDSTSEALDERSLDLEDLDLDDFDAVARLAGSSSRGVTSVITNWLNKMLKKFLTNIINSYYNRIGLVVTYPLRYLLNWIIDILLRCTSCSNLLQTLDELSLDGLNQLETLDLSKNRLVQIHPASMKSLVALKNVNMADNEVNLLGHNLLITSTNIQNINMNRNKLSEIFAGTFDSSENLEVFDSSHNLLVQFPPALYGREHLEKLDLSSNRIKSINSTILNSLTSLRELKLSRNFIKLLEGHAFTNLKQLKNIHLDDNELEYVEPNSLKMLPRLKSIKLDRNRIAKLPNMAFNNLPLLQKIELQHNKLNHIEPNAFNLVPYLLLLNLSHNELRNLDNVGLQGLDSVELLDLSFNRISRLKKANLRRLEWLVELRMDNNELCEVEDGVFDNMLRLKALSLENNRIVYIPEMAAQRLRSNIANIDIKGNPLLCSCDMLWLQAWLKESSQEGPECSDGTPLREMRLAPRDCPDRERSKTVRTTCDAESQSGAGFPDSPGFFATSQVLSNSKYSLKNSSMNDLGGSSKGSSGNKNYLAPSPEESDYFYDDYIDYPFNETISDQWNGKDKEETTDDILEKFQMATSSPNDNTTGNTPTLYAASKNPKPTIPPKVSYSPSTSGFTFFGLPIPSFNVSNLFRGKKTATPRSSAKMERKSAIVNHPPKEKRKSVHQIDHANSPMLPELQSGFLPMLPGYGGFKPIPDPSLATPKPTMPTLKSGVRKVNIERSEVVSNNRTVLHFTDNTTSSNRNRKSQLVSDNLNKAAFQLQSIANVKISNHSERHTIIENPNNKIEKNVIAEQSVQKPVFSKTAHSFVENTTTTRLPSTLSDVETEKYDTTTIISVPNEPQVVTTDAEPVDDKPETSKKAFDGSKTKPNVSMVARSDVTTTDASPKYNSTGSILSALLVPGGQQLHVKPSAKSTITKVASPHNSASAPLLSNLEVADGFSLPSDIQVKEEVENALIIASQDDVGRGVDDWYFENYNRHNVEPFVAKIINTSRGSCRYVYRFWLMVVVVSNIVIN